ncbi:enolase C-terminal domain-like protein [Limibacillus halophilus]
MRDLIFTSMKVRAADVPVRRPVVAKVGSFPKWAFICVDVETAGGIVGRGYVAPYLIDFCPAISSAIETLAERFKGREIAPAAFFDEGMKAISLLGQSGIALYALAALDIAFWDAHAKAADKPLAEHLGGSLAPVPAYNSNGLWLGTREGLDVEAAALAAEGGFTAMKVRLGRDSLAEDLAAITAVRQGAGAGITLLSDFNQGMTFDFAKERLAGLDEAGLGWFEEPIAYHELDNCAELTRRLKTPVILGENFHGSRDLKEALARRACDLVMPDLMRIGGVTGWLRAAALAEAWGAGISSHLFPEVSAHLLRVSPTAQWLEWTDWANPLLKEPFEVKAGALVIPKRPGNGIDWDEKALARFAPDF